LAQFRELNKKSRWKWYARTYKSCTVHKEVHQR